MMLQSVSLQDFHLCTENKLTLKFNVPEFDPENVDDGGSPAATRDLGAGRADYLDVGYGLFAF